MTTSALVLAYTGFPSTAAGRMLEKAVTFRKPLIAFCEEREKMDFYTSAPGILVMGKYETGSRMYGLVEINGRDGLGGHGEFRA